jgi:hypothetical protein
MSKVTVNNYHIAEACSTVNFFQYHYAQASASSVIFTFVIHLRDVSLVAGDIAEKPFFTRSVDLVTGALVTTYDSAVNPLVVQALDLHFSQAYAVREGLASLRDYLQGGSTLLDNSETYGQTTFYSDLEELDIGAGVTITPGQRCYYHNSGSVSLD